MTTQTTPLANGTRVHHRSQLWSFGWSESQRKAHPTWGWGTVVGSITQHDGTHEYEVRPDAQMFEHWPSERTTWWSSYHIDRAEA